ncbi:MAG: hypothetical protein JSV03_14245, partial [Planctomycetota bacterium]
FVLKADGTLLHNTLLDEPVRCLTALQTSGGESVVLVGTQSSLRCLRLDNLAEIWRIPKTYQRLEPLRSSSQTCVLAISTSGELQRFDL